MKKIMITAAVICMAAFTQAATYNWSMSFAASPDDENPLAGTVYAFDATAYSVATVTASLADDGTGLAGALNSAMIDADGVLNLSGTGLTDNGASPAFASMFAIIVSEGSDGQNYFYTVDNFSAVKITDAVAADKATYSLDYVGTGAVGGANWTAVGTAAVPEPTSGLLLLLGVAGLALKRKRA